VSERDGGGSRWSSAREREDRRKQRAQEREAAKRERLARESVEAEEATRVRRGLSDEERQTIRTPRFSSTPSPAPEVVAGDTDTEPDDSVVAGSTVGTRWRDSVAGAMGGGSGRGSDLPPLPGDEGEREGRQRPANGRLIIFGACLFGLIAVLLFTPLGPFGDEDEPIRPTPSSTLPSILGTEDAATGQQVPAADEPQAEAGQAVVCIDAGHGGWDTGWNRAETGDDPYAPPIVTEAQLNLGLSYMLKAELEAMGYFVVLTRPSGAAVNPFDQDINGDGETRSNADNWEQAGDRDELQARINICNEAGADVLISLHFDGFDNQSVRGFHVFYTAERDFGEQNELLANLVYREMDEALRDTEMADLGLGARRDSEINSEQYESGTADHFIMTGPAVEFASISPSEMPGIIVEGGFLSNDADAAFIAQPDNQQLLAEAYARGIQAYFEQYPPQE
jgi:N-acetylmuramoyl-L-alanine amidase